MRMWKVDPKTMCQQHLLGEHVEMHMMIGTLKKGRSVQGFVDGGLMEVHNVIRRHDRLAREMVRRGMNHKSPAEKIELHRAGRVDVVASLRELKKRCPGCRARQIAKGVSK